MSSKAKMKILKAAINHSGMAFKPQALEGLEIGMKSRKKAILKKYGCLTTNYLMEEIIKDTEFQAQMARLDITREVMEDIAKTIITNHENEPKIPNITPKNAPCPCGSGKKFKRCCRP